MYLLEFVNHVRQAQSYEGLAQLPPPGADGSTPLELAMGCRLEHGVMRLSSPLVTISLPDALAPHAEEIASAREAEMQGMAGAR
jgi:hypothetical protein